MRSNWKLAETGFGIVLEKFRLDAIEPWLRQNLELPWNYSDEMQLNLGSDRISNCLRLIPMSCNWKLTKEESGIALE